MKRVRESEVLLTASELFEKRGEILEESKPLNDLIEFLRNELSHEKINRWCFEKEVE
jgi:hypothetical protein